MPSKPLAHNWHVRARRALEKRKAIARKREMTSLKFWSRRQESNPQPTDYKSVALPLSHTGDERVNGRPSPSMPFRVGPLYDNVPV